MKNSKLKSQSSKPQLKTLKPYPKTLLFVILKALSLIVILRAKPEGSHAKQVRDSSLTLRMTLPPFCHPEGEARRIPCQLAEGFFAGAQNDNEKLKTFGFCTWCFDTVLDFEFCALDFTTSVAQ